jgi:putative SOS response-associated peptidase YedK
MSLIKADRIPERFPAFRLSRPFAARYNLAPTQDVLALRADAGGEIAPMRWGLVPAWSEDTRGGGRLVNARAETIATKPAFRQAVRERRAVVFADGYYEWANVGGGKQPYHFTVDGGEVFAFAAIWDRWGTSEAELETCAIATVPGNEASAFIDHDRMPAILADEASIAQWLAGDLDTALAALAPFDPTRIQAAPVSAAMNRTSFEDARAVDPIVLAEPLRLF